LPPLYPPTPSTLRTSGELDENGLPIVPLNSHLTKERFVLNRKGTFADIANDFYEDVEKPLDNRELSCKLSLIHNMILSKITSISSLYGDGRVRGLKTHLSHVEYLKTTFGQGYSKYSIRKPLISKKRFFNRPGGAFKLLRGSGVRGREHIIKHTFDSNSILPVIFPINFHEEHHIPNVDRVYDIEDHKGANAYVQLWSKDDLSRDKQTRDIEIARMKECARKSGFRYQPYYARRPPKPVTLTYNWEKCEMAIAFDFIKKDKGNHTLYT